jgi:adenine-specific DNA-methyltransferase
MDSVDNVSLDHEYVLCYGKNKNKLNGIARTFEKYINPDKDPRGPWISDNLSAGKPGGDVYYPIVDPETGNEFLPPEGRYWPYSPKTMSKKIAEGRILFPKLSTGRPMLKRFKNEARSNTVPVSTWMRTVGAKSVSNAIFSTLNTAGTKEVQNLLGGKLFPHPKSVTFIKSLASQCLNGDDDIVLDFFSGSSTTAQAVLELNVENAQRTRFIMVQLPESCDEKSEAFKAGYKIIPEIGRERIRRAGKKIKEDNSGKEGVDELDVGFRVLKVEDSNMKDVYYSPDLTNQENLFSSIDNIKEGRTPDDLLFQVLVDWGVELSLPITVRKILGKDVYFVDENTLVACFDLGINEALAKDIASYQPLRVIFRDSGFESDSVKINVEQFFKLMSPGTEIKSI